MCPLKMTSPHSLNIRVKRYSAERDNCVWGNPVLPNPKTTANSLERPTNEGDRGRTATFSRAINEVAPSTVVGAACSADTSGAATQRETPKGPSLRF
jgi:hypothetical protein